MKKILSIFTVVAMLASCGGGEEPVYGDGYDRSVLLANVTDNIIIPAYQNFYEDVIDLDDDELTYFGKNTLSSFILYINQHTNL